MPDNFSNSLKQRIFKAELPPGLKGARERTPEIENQIVECLQFSESELAARLAIADFKLPNYLKGETLICLLGEAYRQDQSHIADMISAKLAKIVEVIAAEYLRKKGFDNFFIEDAIAELIVEMLTQVIGRERDSYDFWEVNFYVALQRLIGGFVKKHETEEKLTATFSELSDGENEDEFENIFPNPEKLTIEEKLDIKEILGKLPDTHRRIYLWYHVEEWTQEQIADVLGITARTVRTRLKESEELLRNQRDTGGEK